MSRTSNRGAVIVPVLSRTSASTRLIASTALIRWTSAPARLIRSAASAYVTVIMIARPCGTSATRTAAAWTRSMSPPASGDETTTTAALTTTTRPAVVAMSRSMSRWSGVRSVFDVRARAVNWFAKLSAPTPVTRIVARPATHALPERSRSPGRRTIPSDSPVSRDSSTSSLSVDELAVEDDLIAAAHDDEVAADELGRIDGALATVADHGGMRRGEDPEALEPVGRARLEPGVDQDVEQDRQGGHGRVEREPEREQHAWRRRTAPG